MAEFELEEGFYTLGPIAREFYCGRELRFWRYPTFWKQLQLTIIACKLECLIRLARQQVKRLIGVNYECVLANMQFHIRRPVLLQLIEGPNQIFAQRTEEQGVVLIPNQTKEVKDFLPVDFKKRIFHIT